MVERLDHVARESTDAWNNAGTGHAAYCELNYTPEQPDGSINTTKAFAINTSFEVSLQFWSYLVERGNLPSPREFINQIPHQSFVWGEKNVEFLRKRHAALVQHPCFKDMEYSEDHAVLREWMPLVMQNRDPSEKLAGTRVRYGSDVNFGALARNLVNNLEQQEGFDLLLNRNVKALSKNSDGSWKVTIENSTGGSSATIQSKFVFLGAGGGALPLLQKSGIAEGKGYGGFPVSGMWLVCKRPEIIERHQAKVYGMAPIGAPPMSVPHLDTRVIDGKKALLFGPFAGFTTKFLKQGSFLDLPLSIRPSNLAPILSVAIHNMDLTRYLISEVLQSHRSRVESLRNFFPDAKEGDWELSYAGQRVQIIKPGTERAGKLEFGTEVITSADGSLAALLGASPGASTAVSAMLSIVERCFAERMKEEGWKQKITEMVPSYGHNLIDESELLLQIRQRTLSVLELDRQD
jgi:malate dehydrogenase (quinone)